MRRWSASDEAEWRALKAAEARDAERLACAASLAVFVRRAWPVLEPGQPYVHGWHLDALTAHLEAVTDGRITRLLINVPPGTMKSLAVGVFWPAWEWGPRARPDLRIVAASHEQGLAVRDSLRMRRLVTSDWYRGLWGDRVALRRDQNAKLKFETTAGGFRQAAAAGSITGVRGDRVIVDDPHSVSGAASDARRRAVVEWFMEAVPTRLNDPARSAIVVIMQRLHERDVAGEILGRGLAWDHLMLPMTFEPERARVTRLGFRDPRSVEGEPLFPARFPPEVLARDRKAMGAYAWAGQMQQRPTPRDGGLFRRAWFAVAVEPPPGLATARRVRAWDLAASFGDGGSRADWTVGVRLARDAAGVFWIEHVVRVREGPAGVEALIRATAAADGRHVAVRLPQDPGQAGKAQAATLIRMLAGYDVVATLANGDKVLRARPAAAQAEAGAVRLVAGAWNADFLDEVCAFPGGAHDDQVDAFADALSALALGSTYDATLGWV